MKLFSSIFLVFRADFQNGVEFDSKDLFWSSFGSSLRALNPHIAVPTIKSAEQFCNEFLTNKTLFGERPVVMFIDEFDKLYNVAQEDVTNSVLDTFRSLKNNKRRYCLHSVVAIGPFSILELTGKSSSPFNVSDAIQAPHLHKKDVMNLFAQFSSERQIKLDDRIPLDVFARTSGHAGLVSSCGKHIDETLTQNRSSIEFDDWFKFAAFELEGRIRQWGTVQKLTDQLSLPEKHVLGPKEKEIVPKIMSARQLLYNSFLPSEHPISVSDTDRPLARYLAAEGAFL